VVARDNPLFVIWGTSAGKGGADQKKGRRIHKGRPTGAIRGSHEADQRLNRKASGQLDEKKGFVWKRGSVYKGLSWLKWDYGNRKEQENSERGVRVESRINTRQKHQD